MNMRPRRRVGPVGWLLIGMVRIYQHSLGLLMGGRCRFFPSCSHYFIEAIQEHGAAKGCVLGIWRILRCQPLVKGGYDPVPPRGQWRQKADSYYPPRTE